LVAAEAYTPILPAGRKHKIHDLINEYLKYAQTRNKKPLRKTTADVRRYIFKQFVSDCEITRVGDITLRKIQDWLTRLKEPGKAQRPPTRSFESFEKDHSN
jgi:hypothetical protein